MLYRLRWFVIAFSMVLALAPFSGIVTAALLAWVLGCEINDAAREPCRSLGTDFGPALSSLASTATLGELAFAILEVVIPIWMLIELVAFISRLRRTR
ncbi:MAG: hypothetical protein JSR99_13430 [Proteobacteria bacterium]|nr:hypothetical protein [Pseudomonadota bacterium]